MNKKRVFGLATAAIALAGVAGCTKNEVKADYTIESGILAGRGAKKTYNMAYDSATNPSSYNYLKSNQAMDAAAYALMVDGLVENDNHGRIVPSIAQSWTSKLESDGKQTWTFVLRNNVTWVTNQDGAEYAKVTANDFKEGVYQTLLTSTASSSVYMVTNFVVGASEFNKLPQEEQTREKFDEIVKIVTGTTTIDGVSYETISYTVPYEMPYFLSALTYSTYYPVSEKFIKEKGTSFGVTQNDILVNGQYRLTEHRAQNKMVFQKNPTYWDADNVHIETINRFWISETDSKDKARRLYESGEIDGFNVVETDNAGYNKYVAGNDGTGTIANPAAGEAVSVLSSSSMTGYGAFNFDRQNYGVTSGLTLASSTTDESVQKATNKAINNVNFRKGFLYGLQSKYLNEYAYKTAPYDRIIRTYTMNGLAIDDNGKDYTDYIVDIYKEKNNITDDNFKLDGRNGNDPVYDASKATEFFAKAKEELLASGLTESDFPIKIEVVEHYQANYQQFVNAMFNDLEQTSNGVLDIVYSSVNNNNTVWRNALFDNADYDFAIGIAWGPDYADPETFLGTFSINGGALISNSGLGNAEGTASDKGKEVLAKFTKEFEEAQKITNDTQARFQAMAEAEYQLVFEDVIIIPYSQDAVRRVQVSKLIPFRQMRAPYGNSEMKYKYMEVLTTPITKTERNALEEAFNKGEI